MKKSIIAAILVCVVSLSALLIIGNVSDISYAASLNYDESDMVFIQSLDGILDYESYNDSAVSATKEVLYNLDLESVGYIYDFTVNGEEGYAVTVNSNGNFEVVELCLAAQNPFKTMKNGERIYLAGMTYAYHKQDAYYLCENDEEMSEPAVAYYRSIEPRGGVVTSTVTETINYTYKSESTHTMCARHPGCTNAQAGDYVCVPVAGANIIQYYDRFCSNLIANYTPGYLFGDYRYYEFSDQLNSVVLQLASDMGTTASAGTTIEQFQSGMNLYCTRAGYEISITSCMNGSALDYDLAKQYITGNKPIVMFFRKFSFATISEGTNKNTMEIWLCSGAHTMVGFGYKEITYTLTSGQTRVDKLIAVATGMSQCIRGYCNIDYYGTLVDAYSVYIS